MVAEGHAWLQGGMHGCRGHVWLWRGMSGCWGACMVARGMCVVARGHAWLRGACTVAGGWVCVVVGGMHGCGGHAWLPGGLHRIRQDTVNERAVRILLECILVRSTFGHTARIYYYKYHSFMICIFHMFYL